MSLDSLYFIFYKKKYNEIGFDPNDPKRLFSPWNQNQTCDITAHATVATPRNFPTGHEETNDQSHVIGLPSSRVTGQTGDMEKIIVLSYVVQVIQKRRTKLHPVVWYVRAVDTLVSNHLAFL